ncbi:glycosyltransferase family 2 protein [Coralloluteibacterium stylophorae]|uniref:Glycosyltransferase family 2 protein n=3 Tax=Coralloluteibacterium stylophorae TaxID=1776034 RepID=A0AAP2CC56_9GAMM|nr:glycosyltransferase family 2 protein [Coralloluteibacterium stylophorae]
MAQGQAAVGAAIADAVAVQQQAIARVDQSSGAGLEHLRALLHGREIALHARLDAHERSVAQLAAQQALLLQWARRRSPGYWLGRLLGRPGSGARSASAVEVSPLANLDCSGAGVWSATSDDPQFLLSQGAAFEGGWYLFEADFDCIEGEVLSPCLYPDYGSGISELERVFLPAPDARGRLRAIVRLKFAAAHLRFDPSVIPLRFRLQGVALRRIGRADALLRMALWAAGPERTWRRSAGILRAFATEAAAGRLRQGGELAYARYVQARQPAADDYGAWVRSYDTLRPADLEAARTQLAQLERTPLVSILLPVYQTPEKWLRRCLDSVLEQVYPHWELCIADDASPSRHVRRVLEEYASRDRRIRVQVRSSNGHISEASNTALEMAKGDYIALLDHDDELRPHSLLEMVKAIDAHPEWRLLYSDEDKIDEKGRRFAPYFKPDWNYELFLSQNCICHLGVYETALVRGVGGFRRGFEGSQDWDLALRCVERLAPHEIGHVSKVLYHWRAIQGSTAMGVDQKDYAGHAGLRAVDEHLQRRGQRARIEINPHGHLNVHREAVGPLPRVSLIIPTRDKVELLRMSVGSILAKTDYPDLEIIVVDNQSAEQATLDYFAELEADGRVRVVRYDAPFNYSAINNHAARHATGAIVGLVNNDIEVIEGSWLRTMVAQAVRPEIGAVGAMLYYPDDTIQHAGVVLGMGGVAGHVYTTQPRGSHGQCGRALLAQEMSAVTAACLVVRREVFEEVGGLDETLSVAFNDIDFCLRIRVAGYRNLWTPYAELYHHESASRGYEDTPEKQARFRGEVERMRERWGEVLVNDPCYNPNLTLTGAAFDLAFPPR